MVINHLVNGMILQVDGMPISIDFFKKKSTLSPTWDILLQLDVNHGINASTFTGERF